MNRLRIKHNGDKLGVVQTVLKSSQPTRTLASLSGDELAQLIVDVWTLPQIKPAKGKAHPVDEKPSLRPGEDENLLKALMGEGRLRYGRMFNHVVAQQYMKSAAA